MTRFTTITHQDEYRKETLYMQKSMNSGQSLTRVIDYNVKDYQGFGWSLEA